MFSGIVEEAGIVRGVRPTGQSIELTVEPKLCARGVKVGDSVAVNGCCLTVARLATRAKRKLLKFDLLVETWNRTNLQDVFPGALVNLERSLRAGSPMGGHFVTGHIDGVGRIVRWERSGQDWVLEVAAPAEVMRYLVFKGSVAVDGISLTVAGVLKNGFRIWIIPHTYKVTNLRRRAVGEAVNLEADLIGKYVEQILRTMDLRRK
jgi:riboflavin synthase